MCVRSSQIYDRSELLRKVIGEKAHTQCQTTRRSRDEDRSICHKVASEKCLPSKLEFLWLFRIHLFRICIAFFDFGYLHRASSSDLRQKGRHPLTRISSRVVSGRGSDRYDNAHLLYTSALRVLPMILPSNITVRGRHSKFEMFLYVPRCGTLLQYGRADVIRIFCSPSFGSLEKGALQSGEQEGKLAKLTPIGQGLAPIEASLRQHGSSPSWL